jgi:hypothetical protein
MVRGGEVRHRENIAHYCCAITFRGFCASKAPGWDKYNTIFWIHVAKHLSKTSFTSHF